MSNAGLSTAEANRRTAAGQANVTRLQTSRRVVDILRSNIVTPFNALLGALFLLQVAFGSPADALFGLLLVLNTAIGIFQELRAKVTLDRLALLIAPKTTVIHDGRPCEVAATEVVLGDLAVLQPGDQVVADGTVESSEGLEIDQSLITGESAPVTKMPGAEIRSGSFVAAGAGSFVTTAVGADSYAQRLAAEGRGFARVSSDLQAGINRILRFMAVLVVPVGALVVWNEARGAASISAAVTGTVAALVGMIPEGLVLLTTIAFTVGALRLVRRNCLVQELPAVEGLARVDVICVDKTGTLTEPRPAFSHLEPLGATPVSEAEAALAAVVSTNPSQNSTAKAIASALPTPAEDWSARRSVPFSSARKWSAAAFADHGTWVLGAPEMLEPALSTQDAATVRQRIAPLAERRSRVLLLARGARPLVGDELPETLTIAALVVLDEQLRPDAADTIRYFTEQGVAVKVISGDAASTVAAVAIAAGVPGAASPGAIFDARTLTPGTALDDAMRTGCVFGRVTPEQKRDMVDALRRDGHTVAMTGDGVNDVLALKHADIGIAMGSGSAATKSVAQLVLLDDRFATMPLAVAEGRRVTANTERVANLFLTKTSWATLLAVITSFTAIAYPLLPRHLTLVGSLSIGIPAFFLALAPNTRHYVPGFLGRVVRFALPAGTVIGAAVFATYEAAVRLGAGHGGAATLATVLLTLSGLGVIAAFERPARSWRLGLLLSMAGLLMAILVVPFSRRFFALAPPASIPPAAYATVLAAGGAVWLALWWLGVTRDADDRNAAAKA